MASLKKEQFDRVKSFTFKSNLALILAHPILSPSRKINVLRIESGGYANRILEEFLESFVWLEIWLKDAIIGDIGNKGLNFPPFSRQVVGKPEKGTVLY